MWASLKAAKILLTRETLRPAAFAISLVFIFLPSAKRPRTVKAMGFPRSRQSRDCLYSASSTDATVIMFSQLRKDENMITGETRGAWARKPDRHRHRHATPRGC